MVSPRGLPHKIGALIHDLSINLGHLDSHQNQITMQMITLDVVT